MMYGLNKGCKLALDSNGDPVDLDQARPPSLSFVSSGLVCQRVFRPDRFFCQQLNALSQSEAD